MPPIMLLILPLSAALLLPLVARFSRRGPQLLTSATLGLCFLWMLSAIPALLDGEAIRSPFYLPGGPVISLHLDALSMITALPIPLIAFAISLESRRFPAAEQQRMLSLTLVYASMLCIGLVADRLALTALAYGLTALSAALMLGRAGASALPALVHALLTGIAFFTGLILLGDQTAGPELTAIARSPMLGDSLTGLPLLLILCGSLSGVGLIPMYIGRKELSPALVPAAAFALSISPGLIIVTALLRLAPAIGENAILTFFGLFAFCASSLQAWLREELTGKISALVAAQFGIVFMLIGAGTPTADTVAGLNLMLFVAPAAAAMLAAGPACTSRFAAPVLILAVTAITGIATLSGYHGPISGLGSLLQYGHGYDGALPGALTVLSFAVMIAAVLSIWATALAPDFPRKDSDRRLLSLIPAAALALLPLLACLLPGLFLIPLAGAIGPAGDPGLSIPPDPGKAEFWAFLCAFGLGLMLFGLGRPLRQAAAERLQARRQRRGRGPARRQRQGRGRGRV